MKTDARKLKPDVQQELRKQAVRLRKSGRTYQEIAEIVGVHLTTVCRWYKAYEKHGSKAIRNRKRGRRHGTQRTLDADKEKQIKKLIADNAPDQLKLPFALWTRIAVQQLIERQWAIQMPIRTVGEYLKRWGFTPQKPLRRAYEQSPATVKKWLDEQYPAIEKHAKAANGEIHWGDETGLSTDAYYGRSYAPRGKTPAMRIPAKRENLSLISTVTNRGKMRFMIYRDAMNAKTLIKFLTRLIKDADRKVFLILDNLRSHHSKIVKAWLKEHEDEIELFYLPAYSPELNPDEYLNNDLKSGVHSKTPARTRKQLHKKAISHLRMVQKTPKRVKNYFKHPKVAYAA